MIGGWNPGSGPMPFQNEPICHGMVHVFPSVKFGKNCTVYQFTTICENVTIGDDVVIGSGCWIGSGTVIGNSTRLQHGCFITRNTVIGERVFIGPGVQFTDDKHPVVNNKAYQAEPPFVKDDVSIGANATIMPGVTLGRGACIGAGAVVTNDVNPYSTVVGIPARELTHN